MNERPNTVEENISVADRAASRLSKQASLLGVPFDDVQQEARMAMLRLHQTEPDASPERVFLRSRDAARDFLRSERRAQHNLKCLVVPRELQLCA